MESELKQTNLAGTVTQAQAAGGAQLRRDRLAAGYIWAALLVSCVYFAQLYATFKPSYLNLHAYALGQERMPFQAREFMRYPLLWAEHLSLLQRWSADKAVINTPQLLMLELLNCFCLVLAGWSAVKLYRFFAPQSRMPWLPFALLILLCLFDFYLAVPFSFPYDLPATMFLGWGTYLLLTRQFGWLVLVFALGTWNRETTLFLILFAGVLGLTRNGRWDWRNVRRTDIRQIAVLSCVWLLITAALHHRYADNSTEAGSRISGNVHALLHPMLWPSILSASAFLLPWIWLRRDSLPTTLRAGVLLLPLWVVTLLSVGQILELRIYGDISVFIAVCAAWLFNPDRLHVNPDRLHARTLAIEEPS